MNNHVLCAPPNVIENLRGPIFPNNYSMIRTGQDGCLMRCDMIVKGQFFSGDEFGHCHVLNNPTHIYMNRCRFMCSVQYFAL